MSCVAIIVGISGREFFLDRDGAVTDVERKAKRFRSEGAAVGAAQAHITAMGRRYCPAVAKHMGYRVSLAAA